MIQQTLVNKLAAHKSTVIYIIACALLFPVSYILKINFVIPLFLICIFAYLKNSAIKYNLLYAIFLFVIIFVSSYFIVKEKLPYYYIPFCAIPMLSTMLFLSLELTLLVTLASSVSIAYLTNNIYLGILFLTSGTVASILVLKARSRSHIIRAGFIAGLTQMAALFFIQNFKISFTDSYVMFLLNGIISAMAVIGVLRIFEYLFNTVTNVSLLELADFNHPLLQRMTLEIPGTYHHSLVVGNLSEAAAQAIGANALLARIGAYYHDIGKLQKPQYFSENQNPEDTGKHEGLTPTMSKMVIMNHVNEGVELAKEYKLNTKLVDFIKQHHGTSLVYYFYRRALEGLEDDQEIMEEGFRYPGPKPDTKETAIVLLADSAEAATRALTNPDAISIKNVVHKIINNKFIDGQLEKCNLSLADLEKISAVFIRILAAIYHARVTYPEVQKSGNNHKESSKENSHPSQKDKTSGS